MPWEFEALSLVGRGFARNLEVADAFPSHRVLFVADACHGTGNGKLLGSAVVRDAIGDLLRKTPAPLAGDPPPLRLIFDEVVRALQDRSPTSPITAACAVVSEDHACVGWIGDCRAYSWNRGGIVRRTRDHSLQEEYWQRTGRDDFPSERRTIILKALIPNCEPGSEPDFVVWNVAPGDTVFLCTKGLCRGCGDGLTDDQMSKLLSKAHSLDDAARRLAVAARNAQMDNVSLAMARLT